VRILNYGSLNIDHVYRVGHIVRPGETLPSREYQVFGGGKGANQSLAIARAGGTVCHAGKVGADGEWLLKELADAGVDVGGVQIGEGPSGHALIQVDEAGENAIVLFAGTNRQIERDRVDSVLSGFGAQDVLLLQNEISELAHMMNAAAKRGIRICLNPAPFTESVQALPLEKVGILIANELEGGALTGEREPAAIVSGLCALLPQADIVLTRGAAGVLYGKGEQRLAVPAFAAEPVDTTGAGDTFVGYYLAEQQRERAVEACLKTACRAAALCVARKGAMASIPTLAEVQAAERGQPA